ncbi:MAG: potassium transporter TrkG [Paludibacteraceae bacterium]
MAEKPNPNRNLLGINKASFTLAVIAFILSVVDLGFRLEYRTDQFFLFIYHLAIALCLTSLLARIYIKRNNLKHKIVRIDMILSIFLIFVLIHNLARLFTFGFHSMHNSWTYIALFLVFLREVYNINFRFRYKLINPAQLFVASFFIIILMGSLLLMLPNATRGDISYVDALFTATSAVCVTGLTVVDTGSVFTLIGQTIIIALIQIGGLGIMTFTSYFSYFFRSGATYENQMYMGQMSNVDKLDDVFNVLKKIILVTFSIEASGAVFLYSSISNDVVMGVGQRIYFSVFHSVSAFCNAGFSPLKNNLFEITFRYNYFFQLVIALLIITGGIGFPIIFNVWKFFIYKIGNSFKRLVRKREKTYLPWVLNLNSKVIITTTAILLISGTVFIFLLEYNNTLTEHRSFFGKLVVSFFGSVTTRTAGFNSVDTAAMTLPVTLIFMLLMWIGASPASTGGGIKTSTIAVACMNVISIARGKKSLEIFGREISQVTINKSSAIILLSFAVIFVSSIGVSAFDSDKSLLSIVFEVVSAYGTVGLSRGITGSLTDASKIIIVITMFLGRVGMITFLMAIIKKSVNTKYRYPSEEILIN